MRRNIHKKRQISRNYAVTPPLGAEGKFILTSKGFRTGNKV